MSSAAILGAVQNDPHLLATKDVKDDHLADHWMPIPDVNMVHVQDIAKFAVREHNKQAKDDLKYKCVIRGWTMAIIGGIKYRLDLEATHDHPHLLPPLEGKYQTVVLETATLPVDRKLEYFLPMNKN